MTDKVVSRKGYISADFLTESYRISGDVNLRNQPLVDMLNDVNSHFVRVESVYVSPINDPVVFSAQNPIGQVRKDRILAVVLPREEDGFAKHTIYSNLGSAPIIYSLFVAMPGFELRGGLRMGSSSDIENMLIRSVDPFITIYRATAKLLSHPDIQFNGGSILVNREMATMFAVERARSSDSVT